MKLTTNIWLFLVLLISISQQLEFFKIEQRFKENQNNRSLLRLPTITQQLSLQDELSQYTKMHASAEFQQFKPDPELSSKLLLKKEGSRSQSLFFTGKQLNTLLLEITVTHKGDHYNHEKDSIDIYLLNYQTDQILMAEKVKHVKLFKVEVVSELYELIISHDWPNKQNIVVNDTEEVSKHIVINMDIVPISTSKLSEDRDDGATTSDKLAVIKSETDRVFINSLDIWQQISKHHEQHYSNQQQVYLRAYFQLIIVFAINFIELMLIRRTLKLQSLI